jgi:hypothetical protein
VPYQDPEKILGRLVTHQEVVGD